MFREKIVNDMFQCVLFVFDKLCEFKHHDSCLEDEHAQTVNSWSKSLQLTRANQLVLVQPCTQGLSSLSDWGAPGNEVVPGDD